MKTETDLETIRLKVQETLDELLIQRLIPFSLTAQRVKRDGPGEYEIPFYDSRLHSIRFCLRIGYSFKEVVRAAVLDGVRRMSGPLPSWSAQPPSQNVSL